MAQRPSHNRHADTSRCSRSRRRRRHRGPACSRDLLTLDCDSMLCTTWRPKSTAAARSEIDAQEKFISFFKVGVLTRVMSGRDFASLETGAGARAANTQVDDLGEVIRSLDKKGAGRVLAPLACGRAQRGRAARHCARRASGLRRCAGAGDGRDARQSVGVLCHVPRQRTSSTSFRCGWRRITMRDCPLSSLRISAIHIRKIWTTST